MKRLLLGALWCLLVIFISGLFAQNCLAEETMWAPGADGAVIVTSPSLTLAFGIDNLCGTNLQLFSPTVSFSAAAIYFTPEGQGWQATAYSLTNPFAPIGSISSASSDFGFYFSGDAYTYKPSGLGASYTLTSSKGAAVTVVNASDPAPTPLPAPAILFGSGLLGLIGIGIFRRRQEWRQLNRTPLQIV